jgi:rare lipoprotein A
MLHKLIKIIIISLSLFLFYVISYFAYHYHSPWGLASYYLETGANTASGEAYEKNSFTAAHRYLPFGTKVRVTNLENNLSVVVRINDRGPYVTGRIIDLSWAAAKKIDILEKGVSQVNLEILNNNQ